MAKKVQLSLGLEPLELIFDGNNEPITIMVNLGDADILTRLFEAEQKLKEQAEEFDDIPLDKYGLPKSEEYVEQANKLNNLVYDTVDYVFNAKVSQDIFKYSRPFATPTGIPFVYQFFDVITPLIMQSVKKTVKKTETYTNKYIQKYMEK